MNHPVQVVEQSDLHEHWHSDLLNGWVGCVIIIVIAKLKNKNKKKDQIHDWTRKNILEHPSSLNNSLLTISIYPFDLNYSGQT